MQKINTTYIIDIIICKFLNELQKLRLTNAKDKYKLHNLQLNIYVKFEPIIKPMANICKFVRNYKA
jgi:hypothetical protein